MPEPRRSRLGLGATGLDPRFELAAHELVQYLDRKST